MKYVEHINKVIRERIAGHSNLVLFGQNISAGSCISGLTKDLSVKGNSRIINSTNSENSLCGLGFGLMMGGASAVFFMKQLDFLTLGIDHLVNTYNIIRNMPEYYPGSFTIMPVIMDHGYQGAQSSFNNFSDICSMARVPGFAVTNKTDAEKIISAHMVSPGFRIIGVSQRLFNEELIVPDKCVFASEGGELFQYSDGQGATIICFNFSYPYGYALLRELGNNGIRASLFNVNALTPIDWEPVKQNVIKTKRIILIDDSKSQNLSAYALLADLYNIKLDKKIVITRKISDNWLNPVSDEMRIDNEKIIRELKNK